MSPNAIISFFIAMFVQSIPGAVGTGMITMIMYVILTLFVVGLMVGKTPEFLSMKISPRSEKPIILVGIEYCEGERSLLSTGEIITVLVVGLISILMVKVDPQSDKQGFRAGYHDGLDSVFRQNKYTLSSQHKIGHPRIRTIYG